jgi:hypothetical protein
MKPLDDGSGRGSFDVMGDFALLEASMVATDAPHRTPSAMTVLMVDSRLARLVEQMRTLEVEHSAGMLEADRLLDVRLAIVRHPMLTPGAKKAA